MDGGVECTASPRQAFGSGCCCSESMGGGGGEDDFCCSSSSATIEVRHANQIAGARCNDGNRLAMTHQALVATPGSHAVKSDRPFLQVSRAQEGPTSTTKDETGWMDALSLYTFYGRQRKRAKKGTSTRLKACTRTNTYAHHPLCKDVTRTKRSRTTPSPVSAAEPPMPNSRCRFTGQASERLAEQALCGARVCVCGVDSEASVQRSWAHWVRSLPGWALATAAANARARARTLFLFIVHCSSPAQRRDRTASRPVCTVYLLRRVGATASEA